MLIHKWKELIVELEHRPTIGTSYTDWDRLELVIYIMHNSEIQKVKFELEFIPWKALNKNSETEKYIDEEYYLDNISTLHTITSLLSQLWYEDFYNKILQESVKIITNE